MGKITFTAVEDVVNQSKNLSAHDKMFYWTLKTFRNRQSKQCFPSIKKVCEQSGISKRTAYKCRKNLKELGIIDFITHRGRKKSCRYRFILEDGNSQEISTALSNLSENKIEQMGTTINRANGNLLNRANGNLKIEQNSTTNHKKVTIRKEPHTEPSPKTIKTPAEQKEKSRVCVSSDPLKAKTTTHQKIPQDILDDMDRTIEQMRNNGGFTSSEGAYRNGLIKSYHAGTYQKSKIPVDNWEFLNNEPYLDPDAKPLSAFDIERKKKQEPVIKLRLNTTLDGEPIEVSGREFLEGKEEMEPEMPLSDFVSKSVTAAYYDGTQMSLSVAAMKLEKMAKSMDVVGGVQ